MGLFLFGNNVKQINVIVGFDKCVVLMGCLSVLEIV